MKIIKKIFIFLGIIFSIIIILAIALYVINPMNIRKVISSPEKVINTAKVISGKIEIKEDGIDKNPLLNETQEAQLEAIGIDPASLPSTISPEMEACFVEKLGEARVKEIVAGDSPSTSEILQTSSCL